MQFNLITVASALTMAASALAAPAATATTGVSSVSSTTTSSAPVSTPTSKSDPKNWTNCGDDNICTQTNTTQTLTAKGNSIYYFGTTSTNAASRTVRVAFQPSAGAPSNLEPVIIPGVFIRDTSVILGLTRWRLDFDLPCGAQAGTYDLNLRDEITAGVKNTPHIKISQSTYPYSIPSTDAC